jgi:CheY-like chemotaxis protein
MTRHSSDQASMNLIVVDDDAEIRALVTVVAAGVGFRVHEAESYVGLTGKIDGPAYDAMVLDLSLSDADGIEVLRFLASRNFRAPIIIANNHDDRLLSTACRLGESYGLVMAGQLRKPLVPKDLRQLLGGFKPKPSAVGVDDLRTAIEKGHLCLHYQPKVDLTTGQLLSAEALARWIDPVRGVIGPDVFIGMAEDNGLMAPMMEHLLDVAAKDHAVWSASGVGVPIAVNLSAGMLSDLTLPDRLTSQLGRSGLDPRSVIIEVTESTAMKDPTMSMDVLTRLRIKGFRLSL